MKEYKEGLVIGKFYPPHLGHKYLIETALDACDHVTVLVMGTEYDTISIGMRGRMLRGMVSRPLTVKGVADHVYDDYKSKTVWKVHNTLIENKVSTTPNAVFTSEEYGDELADNFGATHICVDLERRRHPISATAIRRDVYGQWRHLDPVVRRYFTLNVTVMGGESTGTTTLARGLQRALKAKGGVFTNTPYIPEYGRTYTEERIEAEGTRDLTWNENHFWKIAENQTRLFKDASSKGRSPVIVNDTDSIATEAFARYFGVPYGEEAVSDYGYFAPNTDLYLITDHMISKDRVMPLVDDGSRMLDVEKRNESTQYFIDVCNKYSLPYALISGTRQERLDTSVKIVESLLKMKSFVRNPIGK